MSRVAYIRVSSVGQNVDRQLPDEKFDKTFTDKASAKDTDRPALAALLDYVRDGDKVVIHSIDPAGSQPSRPGAAGRSAQ